ncbi:MAG: homoserine kinase [Solobacterium sp.]|nr:homoserine kinase [Solobacterium sp.]
MPVIKSPASSANIGPGFDCLGIAFNLYNSFEVSTAKETKLFNVEERYDNADNLFLQAYRTGCAALGVQDDIHVRFDCDIPTSRGLGSSSALICAGITAASVLHDNRLSREQVFQLASEMEGHPDNVAPCLFGGLTASSKNTAGRFFTAQLPLHPDWKFTVMIPDFEVDTKEARRVLPVSYPRETAVYNISHAVLLIDALRTGNLDQLLENASDQIHEPFRRKLIPDFDLIKKVMDENRSAFLISGSGSTCLAIHQIAFPEEIMHGILKNTQADWLIKDVSVAEKGTYTKGQE